MIDLLPAVIAIIIIGVFVARNSDSPIIQVFACIVGAYIVLFPAMDFVLSPDAPTITYAYHQVVLHVFFIYPLLFFITQKLKTNFPGGAAPAQAVSLNILAPAFLLINIASFASIAYFYDLYLVRISYNEFNVTTDAPTIFLLIYRIALESSFFAIIYIIYCVKHSDLSDQHRPIYKFVLFAYLLIFGLFFLINSRMQFLTLLILIVISTYRPGQISNRKIGLIIASILPLAIGLTLLRELVIEQNNRLDASSIASVLGDTALLISGRLNSVIMINRAGEFGYGFDPFSMDLSGLLYFLQFNVSFFTDPELYAAIRDSQLTSPSVYVINSIMSSENVDFPKSMVVDVFLTFGAYGLPFLAYALASIVTSIHKRTRYQRVSDVGFVVAIYILPLIFQFEKEFIGFLISAVKWSPVLIVLIAVRPKSLANEAAPNGIPQHG